MPSVKLKAPAKINLTLDVVGKREDGYHYMEMVMQAVDLYNLVTVELTDTQGIAITCSNPEVPCDERNVCHKAARHFFAATGIQPQEGLAIDIRKTIPMEAGLAGGSTDAAATLVALNELYRTNLTREQLCEIGVKAGADVPFCIVGGTAVSEGIGDLLTNLPPMPPCWIVIAKPYESMKTPECFARYDNTVIENRPDIDSMAVAIIAQDLHGIAQHLCNVFEQVTAFESVSEMKRVMQEYGCLGAAMTGSGTAVFGLFANKRLARRCMNKLMGSCKSVFIARPINHGVKITEITE
ncbi:4-diphosphocytidyl-2-C-methyl-D-erythritol kinase [Hydrogenoanaerobacterium saccharovorans]|uniref:4-diphosphocytidyl-2-C-methyl-D-erythritol kinase n=1 Tax=Hydrogenoanaerobacterium saccharovorans TaxID=474960 RepID=A0A1H8CWQ7_9FIRM|nr:4-(cytidine 5'-diphospho)-2-C-methyl-D-erythritol kinase [Hydrogenoanaerobacterium saccharovorans]RPF43325.1 4-diphosphocytidyl-2-C-methyl-D-erythritol kinase [Hydrogenoanaerobacterium saccharovorans]SEM98758.1 4-diphosphocytidyl-2-C-methyl-D-erythritol kinase [Hydrogenoanaerobacterium saccharovorans]